MQVVSAECRLEMAVVLEKGTVTRHWSAEPFNKELKRPFMLGEN
jgi:hypothetical protein